MLSWGLGALAGPAPSGRTTERCIPVAATGPGDQEEERPLVLGDLGRLLRGVEGKDP